MLRALLLPEGQVDRTGELIQCERRLRDLLRSWKFLPADESSRVRARREIARQLSEAQMIVERQLAETDLSVREIQRYRFRILAPTITAMREWYCLYFDA